MKVYIAGYPRNHDYFLKTFNGLDLNGISLLHIDNHRDDVPNAIPCMSYLLDVNKKFPEINALFLNKLENENKWQGIKDVEGADGEFLLMKYGFLGEKDYFVRADFAGILEHLDKMLGERVVVDIDPDVVGTYKCDFKDTGCMEEDELSEIVSWVSKNRNIEYFFFASDLNFAQKIMHNIDLSDFKLSIIV